MVGLHLVSFPVDENVCSTLDCSGTVVEAVDSLLNLELHSQSSSLLELYLSTVFLKLCHLPMNIVFRIMRLGREERDIE